MAEYCYYCMYQEIESKLFIFGIGSTEDEAKADAMKWAEDGIDGLYLAKCTKRVYNYVDEYGGDADDFRFVLEDGIVKTEDC